jgi:ribonuclease HII
MTAPAAAAALWKFERGVYDRGYDRIAGVDEAGRGPLAGPVVSAAVILDRDAPIDGLADSKTLSPRKRESLFTEIYARAVAVGIGIVDAIEIDRVNILQASLRAMAMAVANLRPRPDWLLIDGPFGIPVELPQTPIPKGDGLSASIAAASIVAKVSRDHLMARYHEDYPQYGFSRHKGYPTRAHRDALRQFGCCPIHRRSFNGVGPFAGASTQPGWRP